MKTITIDGTEYALVPKSQLVATQPETPQENLPGSILEDFIGQPVRSYSPTPQIVATPPSVPRDTVRIVDATSKLGIPKAQPKISEYRQRFKNRQLTPFDVVGFAGTNRKMIQDFRDVPEIEVDKRRPESQRFFYGPGIEYDIPGVV